MPSTFRATSDDDTIGLLIRILRCDSEADVIKALKDVGLWDDDKSWRLYGDVTKNYSSAGNQQRSPESALVEKVVNSVDACLMRKCREAGIEPRSTEAPDSMREAVAMFFQGARKGAIRDQQGLIKNWTPEERTEIARASITLSMTGSRGRGSKPCITIADAGEGQAPVDIPDTILSLEKGLKETIPFVQGKFNMGGTGALRFCGIHNLQLVLSKRAPSLAKDPNSNHWGFTVVRREYPNEARRMSTYRYLAPVGASEKPNKGSILTIRRSTLPIFPDGQNAYSIEAESGTLIKLYEFDTRARTHMFLHDGLQERLDLLLPGLALPVRLHECRNFSGSAGSFETTLTGLEVRLVDSPRLENGFPDSGSINVEGERIGYTIYAFKKGAAQTYRRNEGVIFVVNGQTHAYWAADRFFQRKRVGMGYLHDSLLIIVDCSHLSPAGYEQLFMNSRDRLAECELAKNIEDELEDLISRHGALQALRAQRREQEAAEKLGDSKPLENALNAILKKSPALSALFIRGTRLANPFAASTPTKVGKTFSGQTHPTFFKFKDRPYGEVLIRSSHLGQRVRLLFETDVVNDYFTRDSNPGVLTVQGKLNGRACGVDHSVNLHDGIASLNLRLPANSKEKDTLDLEIQVTDDTRIDPFINVAIITVLPEQSRKTSGTGPRPPRPNPNPDGTTEQRPAGISLPRIIEVERDRWDDRGMDANSALRIVQGGNEGVDGDESDEVPVYDFFVNVDNIFLKTEQKAAPNKADVLKARFKYGMVLVGLGIIRNVSQDGFTGSPDEPGESETPESLIARTTDGLGPMLLPMIDALGGDLDLEEGGTYTDDLGESGDA